MVLLKSDNTTATGIGNELRARLYWNKFKYRARLNLTGKTGNHLPPKERKREHTFVSWLKTQLIYGELSVRREANVIAIFSNNLSDLERIATYSEAKNIDYTEAIVPTKIPGVKTFVRDPKHKFRVYMKEATVPDTFASEIYTFLERNTDMFPSRSLRQWYSPNRSWGQKYLYNTFFIDFDDEIKLSYLGLMFSEYIGEFYKLEKRV